MLLLVFLYHPASSLLPNLPPSPCRKVSVVLFPSHNSTHLLQTCSEVVEGEREGREEEGRRRGGEGRGGEGESKRSKEGRKFSIHCCPVCTCTFTVVLSLHARSPLSRLYMRVHPCPVSRCTFTLVPSLHASSPLSHLYMHVHPCPVCTCTFTLVPSLHARSPFVPPQHARSLLSHLYMYVLFSSVQRAS